MFTPKVSELKLSSSKVHILLGCINVPVWFFILRGYNYLLVFVPENGLGAKLNVPDQKKVKLILHSHSFLDVDAFFAFCVTCPRIFLVGQHAISSKDILSKDILSTDKVYRHKV
jgi:hypothetical protein